MVITLRSQTESDLFDGAAAEDLATVDVAASIKSFERIWTNHVRAEYPNAEVAWSDSQRTHAVVEVIGDEYSPAEYVGDIESQVQSLAETLFEDGNLWMVERS